MQKICLLPELWLTFKKEPYGRFILKPNKNSSKELQSIFQAEYDMTSSHRTRHKNKMQYEFAYLNYVYEGTALRLNLQLTKLCLSLETSNLLVVRLSLVRLIEF